MHDEKLDGKKIKLISFLSFLMGFSQATALYTLSTYFKTSSGTENIGVFYFIAYLFVLFLLLNLHKIVRKLGKSNVFYFSVLAKIVVMVFLIFFPPSWITVPFLGFYMILVSFIWVNIDVILESFSSDKVSGRVRGLHLTILNAGVLLGPFLSSRILESLGFSGIFLFVLVADVLVLVLALVGLRDVNHKFERRLAVRYIIKKILRRKDIVRIYWVSFALEFFYSLMLVYTPIYLLDLGMTWSQIGLIFTLMLIPFVLIQYPAGVLADKKVGEKELIIFALALAALATLGIFFLDSKSVFVWGAVLFATRIGAALIEVLRDSYFYKRIDGHDVDMIDFFRTALPLAYIISAFLSFPILIFFPMKYVFLPVVLVLILAIFQALKLKDNKSEKEIVEAQR